MKVASKSVLEFYKRKQRSRFYGLVSPLLLFRTCFFFLVAVDPLNVLVRLKRFRISVNLKYGVYNAEIMFDAAISRGRSRKPRSMMLASKSKSFPPFLTNHRIDCIARHEKLRSYLGKNRIYSAPFQQVRV